MNIETRSGTERRPDLPNLKPEAGAGKKEEETGTSGGGRKGADAPVDGHRAAAIGDGVVLRLGGGGEGEVPRHDGLTEREPMTAVDGRQGSEAWGRHDLYVAIVGHPNHHMMGWVILLPPPPSVDGILSHGSTPRTPPRRPTSVQPSGMECLRRRIMATMTEPHPTVLISSSASGSGGWWVMDVF